MERSSEFEWLASLEKFGIRLGLENITKLLAALGNPQNKFPSVLIAGTNGKGSVAAMLQSILTLSGYRTGLYTSPHLVHVEERIRIGYEEISAGELSRSLSRIRTTVESLLKKKKISEHPTYFEILTAATFDLFASHKIKIAVLEVGLGGRFDATNTVMPVLSIITNIEKDHTEYLGTTFEKIAFEKAGIVKECGLLLTGETKRIPLKVIGDICRKRGSYFINALDDSDFAVDPEGSVTIRTVSDEYGDLRIPLPGTHQIENARIAIRAAEILANKGFSIAKDKIIEGIGKAVWQGRLEWIDSEPPILLDGAHNVAAARVLSQYLRTLKEQGKRIKMIFGAMRDKDIDGMMKFLFPVADSVYLTAPDMERAAKPEDLLRRSLKYNTEVRKFDSLPDALAAARQARASKIISIRTRKPVDDSIICICGSLFLVGAFKSL